MLRASISAFLSVVLLGCVDLPSREFLLRDASKRALDSSCETTPAPGCTFANAPVQLSSQPVRVPGRNVSFYAMSAPLYFDNAGQRRWVAPPGTLTDGASIPAFFVPVIGDPTSPEFALASALHDAYCGIGNEEGEVYHGETWRAVHLMFHDALVAAGTEPLRAKVMFAAVWIAGPRWEENEVDLTGVSSGTQVAAMQLALKFIEVEQPDMPRLVAYLDWLDGWMIRKRINMQHDQPGRIVKAAGNGDPTVP